MVKARLICRIGLFLCAKLARWTQPIMLGKQVTHQYAGPTKRGEIPASAARAAGMKNKQARIAWVSQAMRSIKLLRKRLNNKSSHRDTVEKDWLPYYCRRASCLACYTPTKIKLRKLARLAA
uniref:Uncharacterized protein ORF121_1 n=1 Tax=Nothoceros aenigmaticus TaxID=13813 RepID=C3RYL8_9EMBR|nr:hypothetical protein MeaeMp08 [Nothoceros aenigmaticus]ACC86775.1 hypothetical protein MeaeMp08 [Nothoceros aenigmaticus]